MEADPFPNLMRTARNAQPSATAAAPLAPVSTMLNQIPMNNPRILPVIAVAGLALAAALLTCTLANGSEGPTDAKGPVVLPPEVQALPIEQAILTAPPQVPPPIARKHNA